MPAITPDLLERARGSLLGAAVGDAFGMALDGAPPQHVSAQIREMRPGRLPEGHFTGSVGAALAVGESYLQGESRDPEELGRQLGAWQKARRPREGASPRFLLTHLLGRGGMRARAEAAEPEPPDAGPLSRCIPVAHAHINDRNACLGEARRLARLTHQHPCCVAGSAFLAAVIWNLLYGMAPRQAVLEGLEACGDLPESLEEAIREASRRRRDQVSNDDLAQTVLESVVRGLLGTASFAEAVARVTNLGGCASTAGALVGALAGAAYRQGGIPANWRAQVHGAWPPQGGPMWRERQLVDLADRLVWVTCSRGTGATYGAAASVTISV
jgi:ADP-ribosyl-[dinitrogen reductase] hydrolase